MADDKNTGGSQESLHEANRDRADRSAHGGLGAAGYVSRDDARQPAAFLSAAGEVAVINPPETGRLPDFKIGVAWDNVAAQEDGVIGRFFKKTILRAGIDLDLGCLYELKNGRRGGLQALGEHHGALEEEPYIKLSRDERTGNAPGLDEKILISGAHWDEIERVLLYVYIYEGVDHWSEVRPYIQVEVPGEQPMRVRLNARRAHHPVCAVAGIESVRGGIKLTSYLEYFPGHAEMDRAFGYGLEWESGEKR